ncbi:MAG TPA: oligosaccharide flippase family protein, partial [Anaerolineae bacterium]
IAMALVYILWINRLRSLGLNDALLHRQNTDADFMKTYFTANLSLNALSSGLVIVLAPLIQRFHPHLAGLGMIIPFIAIAYFIAGVSQVQETLLNKNLAYRNYAAIDVGAAVVMTIVAPYLAWRGWGIWALVAEPFSGMVTRFLLTWSVFRQWRPRLGWDRSVARWLWGYGKPTWLAANLTYFLGHFDDYWVGASLGSVPLGYYSKAYEYALYPRRLLANPLVTVFVPIFARLQADRAQLSRAFYRSAHVIIRTGFLVAGLFALVMPEFIVFVIGEKWLPMLWTFRLMLIYTVLDPVLMLIGNLMMATGQPQQLRQIRLAQALFFLPAVIVGAFWWGINGVAVAANLMLLVGAWRSYWPLRQTVDFSLARLAIRPVIALVLAWCVALTLEQLVTAVSWQLLALKLGIFLLLFGGFLLRFEWNDYIQGIRLLWSMAQSRFTNA